jgi:hypothetical protein
LKLLGAAIVTSAKNLSGGLFLRAGTYKHSPLLRTRRPINVEPIYEDTQPHAYYEYLSETLFLKLFLANLTPSDIF